MIVHVTLNSNHPFCARICRWLTGEGHYDLSTVTSKKIEINDISWKTKMDIELRCTCKRLEVRGTVRRSKQHGDPQVRMQLERRRAFQQLDVELLQTSHLVNAHRHKVSILV